MLLMKQFLVSSFKLMLIALKSSMLSLSFYWASMFMRGPSWTFYAMNNTTALITVDAGTTLPWILSLLDIILRQIWFMMN
jgi:hypothetical protein